MIQLLFLFLNAIYNFVYIYLDLWVPLSFFNFSELLTFNVVINSVCFHHKLIDFLLDAIYLFKSQSVIQLNLIEISRKLL